MRTQRSVEVILSALSCLCLFVLAKLKRWTIRIHRNEIIKLNRSNDWNMFSLKTDKILS